MIRHISRLRLTAFRNYVSAALDLDSRHLVLTGPNGAGKTNLLEAISLLSPGRGLRRARTASGGWTPRSAGSGNRPATKEKSNERP
jgi:recombinational DNA repair ATPase RecF